ncbi:hypothetical protein JAAARDRAFT_51546 [Jaapia argillacea MUCL 33604]|uniref:Uncharacterized protein n=1 Tax=Jaapia argillacea MUCL 33604 TaxID=933084 RepID=A0A067P7S3_9AGAM|nr:hypothetical protein JAAARDRAFT_51546 [Jaapia argillacea MUCL 33604]
MGEFVGSALTVFGLEMHEDDSVGSRGGTSAVTSGSPGETVGIARGPAYVTSARNPYYTVLVVAENSYTLWLEMGDLRLALVRWVDDGDNDSIGCVASWLLSFVYLPLPPCFQQQTKVIICPILNRHFDDLSAARRVCSTLTVSVSESWTAMGVLVWLTPSPQRNSIILAPPNRSDRYQLSFVDQ